MTVYRVQWQAPTSGKDFTFTTYTDAENEEVAARHARNRAASKSPWLHPDQIIITDVQPVIDRNWEHERMWVEMVAYGLFTTIDAKIAMCDDMATHAQSDKVRAKWESLALEYRQIREEARLQREANRLRNERESGNG